MCNIRPLSLKILLNLCFNLSSKQETVCQTLRSRRSQVTHPFPSLMYLSFYRYVAVNFSSQAIFLFLLFLGMVMYANEVETKEK